MDFQSSQISFTHNLKPAVVSKANVGNFKLLANEVEKFVQTLIIGTLGAYFLASLLNGCQEYCKKKLRATLSFTPLAADSFRKAAATAKVFYCQ